MSLLPIDAEKIKQGDSVAFKEFFESFYPKLMSLACRFVDEQAAADLVQDVFAFYWEQKETIEADNIRAFLYKCLENNCLNYLKHQMVEKEYAARIRLAEARITYLEENHESKDALKQLIDKDLREVIEESIKKLPPRCAEAFRFCYFDDLQHKEIAKIMSISPRTVETHIRQAILFLRDDLRPLFTLIFMFSAIN